MYVLFDIGGTKTRVAISRDLNSFDTPIKFDTPKDFDDGVEMIAHAVETLGRGEEITAVAGGIRGPLNQEKSMIVSESVLTDWVCKPITETFHDRFAVPVYLENDAALVGLGEAHYGAGKDKEIVAYITVSTGVGGARIVDGYIDAARSNFEPGHQIVDIDGSTEGGSDPDTLQDLISGTALESVRGVKPYEVAQSDQVWDTLAKYLAVGLKNTIVYWSPDIIVLGGSMIVGDPRILLEDIVKYTDEILQGEQQCPSIVDASLKDEGGLYGAMALLKQK